MSRVRSKQRHFCCVLSHGIAPTAASGALQKVNILLMIKEATDKDRSLKTQMLLSTSVNSTPENISGEQVWKRNGYFSDEKANLNIEKQNFPENALCDINQGYISAVKGGELAMYNHNHILGQLVVAVNQPKDIDQYMPPKTM